MALTSAMVQAAFTAARSAMPAATTSLRIGGAKGWEITSAWSSGFVKNHANTDQGLIDLVQGSVRYLVSEETTEIEISHVIEAKPDGATEWIKMRVAGRKVVAGEVQLFMGSEYA